MIATPFTHLHLASAYSFKYGTAHIDRVVERASELGFTSLALTDRATMAGAIRFATACEGAGITPILGIDLPFLQSKYRITLLATSGGGLAALYRLVTAINQSSEQILTYELLQRHSHYTQKILALHGPESVLADAIARRRTHEARSIYQSTYELFAGQGIEVVSHRIPGDGPYSTPFAGRSLAFARDHDIPALITNAVRMLHRDDGPVADILDATRKLVPLHQRHVDRRNSEAYLKSSQEMVRVADEIARAAGERNGRALLRTTAEWAERVRLSPRLDIGLGQVHLPEPEVLGVSSHEELSAMLRARCEAGLSRRYVGAQSVKAAERLEEELLTIRTLGFESYFLTVADITDMARAAGIRTAARGSGAGSLTCYLLGISTIEPLSLGLLMERFCSPLRHELPDIDIDVESDRRLEIYDMVFARYGNDPSGNHRCATVAMVETYRARHAIRDVGSALGISEVEIGAIAKALPHIRARNISKALANLPELRHLNLSTPLLKIAIGLAERLDGLPRHLAMHPCAVVLSNNTLLDYAPTEINASNYPMVQFDKDDVEAIGLLKLDILGVRMQSSIAYAIREIERTEGISVDIDTVPLDDHATFDLIRSTRTLGLFQVESPGQRELVGKLAPSTFSDLIIDISLFRPGPVKSDMITPFIDGRHGWRRVEEIHPDLTPILQPTEGVVVFHEQVIEIIATLTGATLAQADEKRRALGDLVSQQEVCDWFYPAALARGYSSQVVDRVWEILRAFASFGFCKAHAAAFALPTYQSAWLKTHHTAAFLAGVLTHDPGMYPKRLILDEARQWGITIAPIDINKSEQSYTVEKEAVEKEAVEKEINARSHQPREPYLSPNTKSTGPILHLPDARGFAIRMALGDVRGMSSDESAAIIAHRPYVDLADFVYRAGVSRPVTEALVLLGAFDEVHELEQHGLNRRDLLLHLSDIYENGRVAIQKMRGSQLTLELPAPALVPSGLPDLSIDEMVNHELELLGMDVSRHVLTRYATFLDAIGAVRSSDLIRHRSGSEVLVAGVKVALQTPPVRSGRRVIFLTLDDGFGCNDLTFFEDMQMSCADLLYRNSLFLARGAIRRTGPRGISLRATQAWDLSEEFQKWRNLLSHEYE